jgi:hypothetical protein
MTRRQATITDHALIRYLERVAGYDVEGLRASLAARLDEAVRLGASAVTIDRHTYMIADGICTTVIKRSKRVLRCKPEREEPL